MRQHRVTALILLLSLLPAVGGAVDSKWAMCELPASAPISAEKPIAADTPIDLSADQAHIERTGTSVLLGDVEMWRSDQFLRADELYYTRPAGLIEARGRVRFEHRGLAVTGPAAELRLNSDDAIFTAPKYRYTPRHARGRAALIERESADVAVLEDATYTTCEPDHTDWLLSADQVTLDRANGDGTARNVVLRFQNVPFLYTPWIRFPIDDERQSGFFFPSIGTSSRSGFQLEAPYYWNIAPHRDATFTPRVLTERGLQLESEFRYLNPSNSGQLELEILNDEKFGDERYLSRVRHGGSPWPRVSTTVDATRVSDDQYFEDFGSSLDVTSRTYLQQRAQAVYAGDFWDGLVNVQGFQILSDALAPVAEPYERLPQVLLKGGLPDQALGFGYDLSSEWVNFGHDELVTGQRYDFTLGVERPFAGAAWFANPAVSVRHTGYSLDETNAVFTDDRFTRTLPTLSLDSGLFFERRIGGGKILQTLEPRLFYLYVPFRSQNAIPVFDSAPLDFSFEQLFRENRFSGPDRIGDANQLTLALTSRFLKTDTGREALRISIGQILYFDEREVVFPGQTIMDDDTSELAGALEIALSDRWTASADALWDPRDSEVELGTTRLRYTGADNRVVNLAYRFRRADQETLGLGQDLHQTDIAFAWPLSESWHAVGRWNYDVEEQRDLELLAGFEYESCCYKLRVAARRFIIGVDDEYNNSIEAQLVLKGLAQLGSPLGELLERGILGYQDDD